MRRLETGIYNLTLLARNALIVWAPKPVPPLGIMPRALEYMAGPAMSTCSHLIGTLGDGVGVVIVAAT